MKLFLLKWLAALQRAAFLLEPVMPYLAAAPAVLVAAVALLLGLED